MLLNNGQKVFLVLYLHSKDVENLVNWVSLHWVAFYDLTQFNLIINLDINIIILIFQRCSVPAPVVSCSIGVEANLHESFCQMKNPEME